VQRVYDRLSPAQRVGQLLMIGLDGTSAASADDAQIARQHVGNVIYLGGWTGSSRIRSTSKHLQSQASSPATGGVPLLIAADQEGGSVQQLKGPGFTPLVSALQQGRMTAAKRIAYGKLIGGQLKAAGVNLNLAPVADTVSASMSASNAPIGKYAREYGHDPATVATSVTDIVHGLHSAGVGATVKHFPGLGRITGNTDVTTTGTTDTKTTRTDSYLKPFLAGMTAGAGAVMMSSARYDKLDPAERATFSSRIITDLLRGKLGWHGVVITDDMNAVAVQGVSTGQRAVRFVAAGGDIVLTGRADDAPTMTGALIARAKSDKKFAGQVEASTKRVLALKQRLGLLHC
jgi:Beta-glucosidase-related glycosidases